MCLGVNATALVLNRNFRKLRCHWRRWLGVFIASNHFLAVGWVCWRWAHRIVRWRTGQSSGAPDRYCSLSGAHHVNTPVGVGAVDGWNPLSSSGTRHVRCVLTTPPDICSRTVHFYCSLQSTVDTRLSLLCWLTGHVRCTPDSPLNYSRARPEETWEWVVWELLGLVHRTLSGAPLATHSQVLCSKSIWVPNLISFLVCVEPYAPVVKDILAN
jgi:hypothetical protein